MSEFIFKCRPIKLRTDARKDAQSSLRSSGRRPAQATQRWVGYCVGGLQSERRDEPARAVDLCGTSRFEFECNRAAPTDATSSM
jgi:hypothetical protein